MKFLEEFFGVIKFIIGLFRGFKVLVGMGKLRSGDVLVEVVGDEVFLLLKIFFLIIFWFLVYFVSVVRDFCLCKLLIVWNKFRWFSFGIGFILL